MGAWRRWPEREQEKQFEEKVQEFVATAELRRLESGSGAHAVDEEVEWNHMLLDDIRSGMTGEAVGDYLIWAELLKAGSEEYAGHLRGMSRKRSHQAAVPLGFRGGTRATAPAGTGAAAPDQREGRPAAE